MLPLVGAFHQLILLRMCALDQKPILFLGRLFSLEMHGNRENGNTLLLSKIHQNYFQGCWHKGSEKRLLRSKMARGLKGQFILSRGCHWRRQWHPTPVLLPGKSHGWRSLVGCSPWGLEESDMIERLHFHFSLLCFGEGNGNPLQCSCLENPRDGVAQGWR